MKMGIGGLGWRPKDFWDATLTEFFAAIHGHNESQGGDENSSSSNAPTKSEMSALVAKYG